MPGDTGQMILFGFAVGAALLATVYGLVYLELKIVEFLVGLVIRSFERRQ